MPALERLQTLGRANVDALGDRWLLTSLAVSVAVHVIVLLFLAVPIDQLEAELPTDMFVIEERIPVPPPPEEPARPAEPVVAEADVGQEITIPETEMIETTPNLPDPPEIASEEAVEEFTFVPRTDEPRCRENCSGQAILQHLPDKFRQAGARCALVLGLRIDTSGRVSATQILSSSGNPACDQAAESWARTTSWTTAYNRDEPVAVWVAQPIEVRSR